MSYLFEYGFCTALGVLLGVNVAKAYFIREISYARDNSMFWYRKYINHLRYLEDDQDSDYKVER